MCVEICLRSHCAYGKMWNMVEWCWGRVYFAGYYFLNKSVTNSSAFRQFERLLKRLLTSCVTRTLLMVTFTTTYFFAMDIAIHFSNKLRKYRTQLHLFMSKKSKLDAYCLAWKTLYVCIPLLLQMVPFKLGVSQSPLIRLQEEMSGVARGFKLLL